MDAGLMLARFCRFYQGFDDERALSMPASRFFLMYEKIDQLEGHELSELCYVSRSATVVPDAFQKIHGNFWSRGQRAVRPKDIDISRYTQESNTSDRLVPMTRDQERDAVMALFSNDKTINRKVIVDKEETPNPRWRN